MPPRGGGSCGVPQCEGPNNDKPGDFDGPSQLNGKGLHNPAVTDVKIIAAPGQVQEQR